MRVLEILILIIILFSIIPIISASDESNVETEIKKITYYAEEYEAGNIGYVQFVLYSSNSRQKLTEILGGVREGGGIFTQEQLENSFGEPQEKTKWVWMGDREIKLDNELPVWRRIIYDGKKIQVRMEAHPSVFHSFKLDEKPDDSFLENIENKIIYQFHIGIEFKRPDEQINVDEKISYIKDLAEKYGNNPTNDNLNILAKESVEAEKSFENSFRQSSSDCESVMNDIFGEENRRTKQKIISKEIDYYEGEDFESKARLEACTDCQWNWINLDLRLESRGAGFWDMKMDDEFNDPEKYRNTDFEEFKRLIRENLGEYRSSLDRRDFDSAQKINNDIRIINDGWNQVSNDLWQDVEERFNKKREMMSDEEQHEFYMDYGWIKEEKEKREIIKKMQNQNLENRLLFYKGIFKEYPQTNSHYTQIEFEKRLFEVFKEFGEEVCDNNIDDNENGEIDCQEDQCGGKVCGFIEGSELYCIEGGCQAKEGEENKEPVCGNNICEAGERINNVFKHFNEEEDGDEEEDEKKSEEKIIEDDVLIETVCGDQKCEGDEGELVNIGSGEEDIMYEKECPEDCGYYVDEKKDDESKIQLTGMVVDEENVKDKEVEVLIEEKDEDIKDTEEETEKDSDEKEVEESDEVEDSVSNLVNNPYYCPEDCVVCPKYDAIQCPEGSDVIFSGKDKNGCSLPPTCVEKDKGCNVDSDCSDKLCASMHCVKDEGQESGECKVKELKECETQECVQGEEKSMTCSDDSRIVFEICEEGKWIKTGIECEFGGSIDEVNKDIEEKDIAGEECEIKSDCGGENDVCSNGYCVEIPEQESEEVLEEKINDVGEIIKEIEVKESEYEDGKEEEYKENKEKENYVVDKEEENYDEEHLEEDNVDEGISGEVIFSFFRGIAKYTGFSVADDGNSEEPVENVPEPEVVDELVNEETQNVDENQEENVHEEPQQNEVNNWELEEQRRRDREERERKEQEKKERKEREERCDGECENRCKESIEMPCVEKCVYQDREEMADLEECKEKCTIERGEDIKKCEVDCVDKCVEGDGFEIKREEGMEHQQEKFVFRVGGSCRSSTSENNNDNNGFIYFDGWGDDFRNFHEVKNKFYKNDHNDWCKWEIENLIKQRIELEEGFNYEFAKWFFEDYLANTAEDWETHQSGIYELYWRDVDLSRQLAERLTCLGKTDIRDIYEPNLIRFNYTTEYGSIEFWEELKTVDSREIGGGRNMDKEITLISPYMKIWLFPPEEFIKSEMKQAMQNHEFPGSPEEKLDREKEEGLTEEEREEIKQDKKFMKKLRKVLKDYNGNIDSAIEFRDSNGEVVFNLLVNINEEDIMTFEPKLPEDIEKKDVTVTLEYERLYDLIYTSEMEMRETRIESPPWDPAPREFKETFNDIKNGVKMFFKVRAMVNSAVVTPESAEDDAKELFKLFFSMMMKKGDDRDRGPDNEEDMPEEIRKKVEELKGEGYS